MPWPNLNTPPTYKCNNRLAGLDYLRGFAALGIMFFHYNTWTNGSLSAASVIERIGIYGVSIFYVLSGLTLYHVYFDKLQVSAKVIQLFFQKRVLRIFPLLWLTMILTMILLKQVPNTKTLFLLFSGMFGFVKWNPDYFIGIWSIGNELVFYSIFPFIIWLGKKSKLAILIFALIALLLYLYFAFVQLELDAILSAQWGDYTNPLNQLFLFIGGFLIGYLFQKYPISNAKAIGLVLVGTLSFVLYPVNGNVINLVTNMPRCIFTICCFIVCLGFYKMQLSISSAITHPLTLLGTCSYGIYLLHPIVYISTGWFRSLGIIDYSETVRLVLSVIITITASHYCYKYFEQYFIGIANPKTVSTEDYNLQDVNSNNGYSVVLSYSNSKALVEMQHNLKHGNE